MTIFIKFFATIQKFVFLSVAVVSFDSQVININCLERFAHIECKMEEIHFLCISDCFIQVFFFVIKSYFFLSFQFSFCSAIRLLACCKVNKKNMEECQFQGNRSNEKMQNFFPFVHSSQQQQKKKSPARCFCFVRISSFCLKIT